MSEGNKTGRSSDAEHGAPEVTYSAESDSFELEVGSSRDSIVGAVVSSVAVATDSDPLDLPPLHEVIDPDALECLLGSTSGRESRRGLSVSFGYVGCQVTVEGREPVRVKPFDE